MLISGSTIILHCSVRIGLSCALSRNWCCPLGFRCLRLFGCWCRLSKQHQLIRTLKESGPRCTFLRGCQSLQENLRHSAEASRLHFPVPLTLRWSLHSRSTKVWEWMWREARFLLKRRGLRASWDAAQRRWMTVCASQGNAFYC